MKLNGAAILIECLIEQNVGTVFGFPGGAVLPIYDELYKLRFSFFSTLFLFFVYFFPGKYENCLSYNTNSVQTLLSSASGGTGSTCFYNGVSPGR